MGGVSGRSHGLPSNAIQTAVRPASKHASHAQTVVTRRFPRGQGPGGTQWRDSVVSQSLDVQVVLSSYPQDGLTDVLSPAHTPGLFHTSQLLSSESWWYACQLKSQTDHPTTKSVGSKPLFRASKKKSFTPTAQQS